MYKKINLNLRFSKFREKNISIEMEVWRQTKCELYLHLQKGRWYPVLRLHVEPVVEPPGHHAVALGGRDRRPEGGDRAGGGRVLRGGGG